METWSRLVTLKTWILTIYSVGVFSICLLYIYKGKATEGLGLFGGGGLTGAGRENFKTLNLKDDDFGYTKDTLTDIYKGVLPEISSSRQCFLSFRCILLPRLA